MSIDKRLKVAPAFLGVCLITLLLGSISPTTTSYSSGRETAFGPVATDPLGHFEGNSSPVGISWTGDGQRIINPSFEGSSLSPWIPIQYNTASGSSATIISTNAYEGKNSTKLALLSGNLTSASNIDLLGDLSQEHVGFGTSARFLASVLVQQLTGTNVSDRVEVSLNLTTSTGSPRTIHYVFASGASLPANSATDAYYYVGPSPIGQWAKMDRNVAADASTAFPGDYTTIDSISQLTLRILGQTQPGPPIHDPRIKYWNPNSTLYQHWQPGLAVVYDMNNNGIYDNGDYVLLDCAPRSCSPPPTGTVLTDDPLIRYVDSNNNNVWDLGEPVIYDGYVLGGNTFVSNNGVYDFLDPVIAGPAPPVGTLLVKIVQNHTVALFDKVELYSATGGSDWVKNGGFETGLTGWRADSSFTASPFSLSGSFSAQGSITNGTIEMAQSIDARPLIDSATIFKASANIATMTGSSPSDIVTIWLGLVDSQYNPVSLYYIYGTGDGSMPSNRTDTIYRKASGFGALNQWLTVNASLSQETTAFNLRGYTPPYSIELVVIEVTAQGPSASSTAFFDKLSIQTPAHTGTAPSNFYAVDRLNTTTYAYTASAIPQGSLHLEIPGWETVLNITSPEGTILLGNEYTTRILSTCTLSPCTPNPRAVDIPDSSLFKHAPIGTWKIFATSTNAIAIVYAEDPSTHAPSPSLDVDSTINLVSQSKDPFGQPLSGIPINLTLWNTNTGVMVGSWPGSTSTQGWWNVSSVTLPLAGTSPGIYSLQAAVSSPYIGIRTFQVSVRYNVAVTIGLSSSQTTAGSSIIISGSTTQTKSSAPASGVNVTISYRLAGDSQWTVLATVKTDSSGKYAYTWSPPGGDYEVKASTGDTQTAPAQSSRAELLVSSPGFFQGPWLITTVGVIAGVVLALMVVTLRRRRTKSQKGQPNLSLHSPDIS